MNNVLFPWNMSGVNQCPQSLHQRPGGRLPAHPRAAALAERRLYRPFYYGWLSMIGPRMQELIQPIIYTSGKFTWFWHMAVTPESVASYNSESRISCCHCSDHVPHQFMNEQHSESQSSLAILNPCGWPDRHHFYFGEGWILLQCRLSVFHSWGREEDQDAPLAATRSRPEKRQI